MTRPHVYEFCPSCLLELRDCECRYYCALCGGETNHTTASHEEVVTEDEG